MKLGIALKLFLILVCLSLIPFMIIGWQLLTINRREVVSSTLELQSKVAEALAASVKERILDATTKLSFLNNTLNQKDLSFIQKQGLLKAYLQANPNILEVAIVERASGQDLIKLFQNDYGGLIGAHSGALWNDAKRLKEGFLWEFRPSGLDDGLLHGVFYATLDDRWLIFMRENFSDMAKAITENRFAGTGSAYLIDRQGRVFNGGSAAMAMLAESALTATAIQNVSTMGSLHFKDPRSSVKFVGSWAPVALKNDTLWILTQQSQDDAYAALRAMERRGLSLLVFASLAGAIVVFYAAKRISRPVLNLNRAAEKIADGDFNIGPLADSGSDEMALLTKTFKAMSSRLKQFADIQVERLLAETTKMETTISSMTDAVLLLHGNKIILLNDPARTLLNPGLTREDMLNSSLENIIDPERKRLFLKSIYLLLKDPLTAQVVGFNPTPNTHQVLDIRYRHIEAKRENSILPIGDLFIFRDITLEKEIEQMKDDFVHMITHDLKNPLTSLSGFIEVLVDGSMGPLNDVQQSAVKRMSKAVLFLNMMVSNVLNVFRVEHGQLKPNLLPCNLLELAQDALEMFKGSAQASKISLTLKGSDAPKESYLADCDTNLIKRVLLNLLSNAMKYTPYNGNVELELSPNPANIGVGIRDSGEGIPQEAINQLFKKYGQIRGRSKEGTGLGLLICKEVIEAHGGKIWVESTTGKGSTFKFILPKHASQKSG